MNIDHLLYETDCDFGTGIDAHISNKKKTNNIAISTPHNSCIFYCAILIIPILLLLNIFLWCVYSLLLSCQDNSDELYKY